MNFGSRVVSMFNRAAPKISRGIGQAANIGRNIGQNKRNQNAQIKKKWLKILH